MILTCVMCSGDDHKDFMCSDLSLWLDALPQHKKNIQVTHLYLDDAQKLSAWLLNVITPAKVYYTCSN